MSREIYVFDYMQFASVNKVALNAKTAKSSCYFELVKRKVTQKFSIYIQVEIRKYLKIEN